MRNILAKLFHNTVGLVIALVRELWFSDALKDYIDGIYEISPKPPYISQLANAQRSKIDRFYGAIHDPEAARRFGASNIDDFSYWAWRSCGVAGVQMVLKAQLEHEFDLSTMELVNEGLSLGGYNKQTDTGWYHAALVQIAKNHGIKSWLGKFVASSQIAKLVLDGNYVLASVKSEQGGHLLLIFGVRIKNGRLSSFLVHDPNNFSKDGDSKEVSKVSFENLSTRRIIILSSEL